MAVARKSSRKTVQSSFRLTIPAGKANPAPPVGPALGQRGVNIMEFCKAFNDATKNVEAATPVPVTIFVHTDRSFRFVTRTPPASYLLLRAAKVDKGSATPNKRKIGTLTLSQIDRIAEIKTPDLNAVDQKGRRRIIIGSARSLGLEVEDLS